MARRSLDVQEGAVYAIPLFVSDKPPLTRFTKKDFVRRDARYCFMRVVSDERGGGLIIEVFRQVGGMDSSLDDIIASGRLFRPVAVTKLPIQKRRWQHVGTCQGYDKHRHSAYSEIELVLSPFDEPLLWRGGTKTPLDAANVSHYEPWTLWGAHQLERRIIEAITASNT
jgi:hypothetical protein